MVVAHDVGQVRDTLRETRFADTAGQHTYSTVDEAITAIAPTGTHGSRTRLTRPPPALPMISPGPGDAWFATSDDRHLAAGTRPSRNERKEWSKWQPMTTRQRAWEARSSQPPMMLMIGVFQGITGLVAIFNDEWYVKSANYTFDLDITAYGWIHLILGIIIFLAGLGLFAGQVLGRDGGDLPGHPDRDRQLLLHPLLPVLVDPHHRPVRLGGLGAHATGGRQNDLSTAAREHATGHRGAVWGPRPDRFTAARRAREFQSPAEGDAAHGARPHARSESAHLTVRD